MPCSTELKMARAKLISCQASLTDFGIIFDRKVEQTITVPTGVSCPGSSEPADMLMRGSCLGCDVGVCGFNGPCLNTER